jgi:hypothetical protein
MHELSSLFYQHYHNLPSLLTLQEGLKEALLILSSSETKPLLGPLPGPIWVVKRHCFREFSSFQT